jgi:hypothetical protein
MVKVQRILKYPVQNKRLIKTLSWTRGGNVLFVQVIKILFTLNDFFVVSRAGYITQQSADPGTGLFFHQILPGFVMSVFPLCIW